MRLIVSVVICSLGSGRGVQLVSDAAGRVRDLFFEAAVNTITWERALGALTDLFDAHVVRRCSSSTKIGTTGRGLGGRQIRSGGMHTVSHLLQPS